MKRKVKRIYKIERTRVPRNEVYRVYRLRDNSQPDTVNNRVYLGGLFTHIDYAVELIQKITGKEVS